jgi:4-coumarate--CoA ligase
MGTNSRHPGIAVLILSPMYRGITTYIMERFDLKEFCQIIQEEKISFAYIVPPVALALAKNPLVSSYNLRSIRMMHSSAAPVSKDLIETIYQRFQVPVKQGYGLSEASPGVATQTWSDWNKPIGCSGRLIPSVSMKFVVDDHEVPTGQEGEILIRGPNVFKGYYNDPKATAQSIDQDGWYRTGDIGYVDKNNNIYITDRVKELIKYNGFQVAPAQLEGLLLAHPAVNDVAVIGVYSEEQATELPRAYIVLGSDYIADEKMRKELNDWLHEKVAPYKRLRGGIRFVNGIPKSTAGKLLRRVIATQARNEQEQNALKPKL